MSDGWERGRISVNKTYTSWCVFPTVTLHRRSLVCLFVICLPRHGEIFLKITYGKLSFVSSQKSMNRIENKTVMSILLPLLDVLVLGS